MPAASPRCCREQRGQRRCVARSLRARNRAVSRGQPGAEPLRTNPGRAGTPEAPRSEPKSGGAQPRAGGPSASLCSALGRMFVSAAVNIQLAQFQASCCCWRATVLLMISFFIIFIFPSYLSVLSREGVRGAVTSTVCVCISVCMYLCVSIENVWFVLVQIYQQCVRWRKQVQHSSAGAWNRRQCLHVWNYGQKGKSDQRNSKCVRFTEVKSVSSNNTAISETRAGWKQYRTRCQQRSYPASSQRASWNAA